MSTLSVGSTSIWKLDPLSVFTETFISPRCRRRRLRRTGGLEADSSGQAEERGRRREGTSSLRTFLFRSPAEGRFLRVGSSSLLNLYVMFLFQEVIQIGRVFDVVET